MKFFEDAVLQARKRGHLVCGDHYLCRRTPEATVLNLCDGVGSGVYANVAAVTCASRLYALLEEGCSLRAACSMVAESMHRARTEEIPFAAFVVARILPGGQYTAYAYENPGPVHIKQGVAAACEQRFLTVQYEMIAESAGMMEMGDALLLCSDGVTHAGIGGGYAMGWETQGLVGEMNAALRRGLSGEALLSHILHTAFVISGRAYWDDTSLALATCREARELTVLTGPPASRADDARVIAALMNAPGRKVICGSSTTEIASRELKRPAVITGMRLTPDTPPEYRMEGVDLITEGVLTLNQAMNLLEGGVDLRAGDGVVFRLCRMLTEADAVTFLVGGGQNAGHEDPLFRQLGVKPRQVIVEKLVECLQNKGKLVAVRRC